ncbi:MAG: alpha/beta hydrolase [Olsenella sp.]|nr:alpha/beta hydrolase [Olsenella sp.]
MADSKNPKINSITKKALVTAAAAPVALFGAVTAVNRIVYRRSNIASASEVYNRITGNKKRMADPVEWDNYLLERSEANEERYALPTLMTLKVSAEDTDFEGMQTFVLNRRNLNDRAVIYLHGKALVDQPTIYHWKFLDTIAHRTRAEVIVPLYPLAPAHTHEESYERIEALYRKTMEKYGADNITIMGDSAGGGLAASFCQHLDKIGLEQPKHLILISPWVDLSLNNPDIAHFETHDPMLATHGLRKAGRIWAHGCDPADAELSAINGEVKCLRNVMVFTGTREIFHPDAVLFHQRVNACGNHSELVVGAGLHNNYPLYPIPEASKAVEKIISTISMD